MLKKKKITWNQNCLIFIILDGGCKKTIVRLEISSLEFVEMQSSMFFKNFRTGI